MKQQDLTESRPILLEDKEGKLLHLEHSEDVVINEGPAGCERIIRMFYSIFETLQGHAQKAVSITTKFDGSPAIIFGINPENRKFFIGTKSVFNMTEPKILYTEQDVRKAYGDRPDLAEKLSYALKYLKAVTPNGVYQGDLMFTQSSLRTATVDGIESFVFRPNTISYVVPKDSELAKAISVAKIGIVLHTKYLGKDLPHMRASFLTGPEPFAKSASVWIKNAFFDDLSGKITMTEEETSYVANLLSTAQNMLKNIDKKSYEALISNKEFSLMFKIYVNQLVKSGKGVAALAQTAKGFIDYYRQRKIEEIGTLKTEKAKTAKKNKIKANLKFLMENRNTFIQVISLFRTFTEIKNIFLGKLNTIEQMHTFIEDGEGFKVISQEGFVAIDHVTGSAIKLVDRLNFSRLNFAKNG